MKLTTPQALEKPKTQACSNICFWRVMIDMIVFFLSVKAFLPLMDERRKKKIKEGLRQQATLPWPKPLQSCDQSSQE